uniref:Uncharacterized protein n=1 Tax=Timema douglasi TaxID=61478 RepID=A0A7R8VKF1_TIMDO|nr:unnamed protein product [Timema douglasi]
MGDRVTSDKFLDDARRGEMHRYKQLAIALESKSYRQMDTRSCSIDSGVVAPSNIGSSCTSSTNSPDNTAPLNRPGITKGTTNSRASISAYTSPQGNETFSQELIAFNSLSIPNENTQSFINLTSSGNQTLELRMASNSEGGDKVLDISDLTCCPHSARVQENSQPLDETSSSIALTASTDLNQYLHTPVNTSGGSSPSTHHLETPPDNDGLWACRAVNPLPLSVESFKLQQKSLCSGVGLEVLSDETYKKSLLTVQYLNEQVTSPGREPRITDSSSEEYESGCCDVTYERHEAVQNHVTVEDSTKLSHSWVSCQVPAMIHTDVSTFTSEMGTTKDKATPMVEENVGNQIKLATNGYEEISGKSVSSLESIVTRDCVTSYESSSPPRLVRSNSYTLEAPSPILLAHLEQMKILSASRDSIMQLQVAGSATPKRRKGWHIPSNSLNIVPFSGPQDISVTVPSSALFALPQGEPKLARKVTTHSKGTLTNQQSPYRKSSSLPSTVSSSPVKLNTSFMSVDLLQCEASKTVKVSSSSKRDTFQKSTKNISSSAIAKTTTSKNTTPKSCRLNHTSKERSNISSPSLPTNCVNTAEDENDSKMYSKLPIYLLECNARSELAKDYCTDTERQPCKLPEQDVRQMLEAVEAKYKQEMAQLLEHQRYQQEKVMMEHKRMLYKLHHQGIPLVAMPESTRLLDLAILQTTQSGILGEGLAEYVSSCFYLGVCFLFCKVSASVPTQMRVGRRSVCPDILGDELFAILTKVGSPDGSERKGRGGSLEWQPGCVNAFPRNDSPKCETLTESMVLNRSGCNRQLFSSTDNTSNTITNNNIDASYNSTNNDAATFSETANNIDILQVKTNYLPYKQELESASPFGTPEKLDNEAKEGFPSPSILATPELLSKPDFGYLTRLAAQALRTVYAQRHPREMADPTNLAAQLKILQETVSFMDERFRVIQDRFGSKTPAATTHTAGKPSHFTAAPPGTLSVEPTEFAWASLKATATRQLAATPEQALRITRAMEAKIQEMQPGCDNHEAKFLVGLMAQYPALPATAQRKVLHRLNMLYITITRSWSEAISASGDAASMAIYPPGYQPPQPLQIIYRERAAPRPPRGRVQQRGK